MTQLIGISISHQNKNVLKCAFLKCIKHRTGLRKRHDGRRVVVTGCGIVSSLGVGTNYTWNQLLVGSCGVVKLVGKGLMVFEKKICFWL